MKLQLAGEAACFGRRERDVQGGDLVDVQVVQHDPDHLRIGIGFVRQPLHLVREVHARSESRARPEQLDVLTDREREVLTLIGTGRAGLVTPGGT